MVKCWHDRPSRISFLVVLFLAPLMPSINSYTASQTSEDVTALSYQAFDEIAEVYQSGGNVTELVSKLNSALGLIHEAEQKRASGDQATALRSEDEARSALNVILDEIPTARERAAQARMASILYVVGLIPVAVALCSFAFYVGLRGWRWYEKTKLFEMRIVEKEKAEA